MPPGVQTTPRMEQLLKEANSLIAGLVHVNPRTLREWHVLTNMESQDEGYDGPSKETLEAVVVRAGLRLLQAGPGQQQGQMLVSRAANTFSQSRSGSRAVHGRHVGCHSSMLMAWYVTLPLRLAPDRGPSLQEGGGGLG